MTAEVQVRPGETLFRCANARCRALLAADHVTLVTTAHVRRFCSVECIAEGQQAHHEAIAAAARGDGPPWPFEVLTAAAPGGFADSSRPAWVINCPECGTSLVYPHRHDADGSAAVIRGDVEMALECGRGHVFGMFITRRNHGSATITAVPGREAVPR
jgi:hypothetical protein